MKRFIFFARVYLWFAFTYPIALCAQEAQPSFPSYVVIGAFAYEQNAAHFTDEARRNKFPAVFEMNRNRNLYYVYVLSTTDKEYAVAEALKLRAETTYFDTWVYSGVLGRMNFAGLQQGQDQDVDPVTGQRIARINPEEEQTTQNALSRDGAGTTEQQRDAPLPPPVRQTTTPLTPGEVAGKNFYFHLFRADNLNTVPGEVEAIDFEKSRKMATYPANEGVKIMMPSGKTKRISFVCQVFGYRKQQQEFDPATPSDDLYLDDKGNLVVPFELIRLQKGDIAIMYNVFFFKDAALMRPESRYEVNNLLDLLKENPSYKIMLHGHTNGNSSGKIIRMDQTGNFFSLSGTKQGFGSAKQLSEERALLIREFLISSGIGADRMNVKAWGGKKPIHDKRSNRAHENVRVEVEILAE